MSVHDFLGNPIEPGCRCVYPVRRGSRMWLTTIRVQQIERGPNDAVLVGYNDVGRRVRVSNLSNCVVVEPR